MADTLPHNREITVIYTVEVSYQARVKVRDLLDAQAADGDEYVTADDIRDALKPGSWHTVYIDNAIPGDQVEALLDAAGTDDGNGPPHITQLIA